MNINRPHQPFVIFDTETTGVDPVNSRICEIAIVRFVPDAEPVVFNARLNPGVPIPAKCTEVHGIKDADVADCATFKFAMREISAMFGPHEGVLPVVCGYNIRAFDAPLLTAEIIRAGGKPLPALDPGNMLDSISLFRMQNPEGPHKLSDAYAFYHSGARQEDAHAALGDVRTTFSVLRAQIKMGKWVSFNQAMQAVGEYFIDKAQILNKERVVHMGKYAGLKVETIQYKDRRYMEWLKSISPVEDRPLLSAAVSQ